MIKVKFEPRYKAEPWIYEYKDESKFQLDLPLLNKEAIERNALLRVWKDFDGPVEIQNSSGQKSCITFNFYWYYV